MENETVKDCSGIDREYPPDWAERAGLYNPHSPSPDQVREYTIGTSHAVAHILQAELDGLDWNFFEMLICEPAHHSFYTAQGQMNDVAYKQAILRMSLAGLAAQEAVMRQANDWPGALGEDLAQHSRRDYRAALELALEIAESERHADVLVAGTLASLVTEYGGSSCPLMGWLDKVGFSLPEQGHGRVQLDRAEFGRLMAEAGCCR